MGTYIDWERHDVLLRSSKNIHSSKIEIFFFVLMKYSALIKAPKFNHKEKYIDLS